MKEKINCLEGEYSAYLSPMGWPGIYSICFSQLDDGKDSFLLDEGFSFLIVVRLIRDNWETVIRNYSTSFIDEIWFDLQDKQLLGIILLPLLMRFSLTCGMWAFIQLPMLSAFKVSRLGFCFGLASGAWVFHWACLSFGPGEWACAPIFQTLSNIFLDGGELESCGHRWAVLGISWQ